MTFWKTTKNNKNKYYTVSTYFERKNYICFKICWNTIYFQNIFKKYLTWAWAGPSPGPCKVFFQTILKNYSVKNNVCFSKHLETCYIFSKYVEKSSVCFNTFFKILSFPKGRKLPGYSWKLSVEILRISVRYSPYQYALSRAIIHQGGSALQAEWPGGVCTPSELLPAKAFIDMESIAWMTIPNYSPYQYALVTCVS